MGMIFSLQTVTPYRLRYLATTQANIGFDSGIIPNAAGLSPDLRTDSSLFRNFPMNVLVSRVIAGADTAAARKLLLSDGDELNDELEHIRAHTVLVPRNSPTGGLNAAYWSVDAAEGNNAGDPPSINHAVLVVTATDLPAFECYVDVDFQHSESK